MRISVTTRFVDREVLAKKPGDPDAADTPIGKKLTVTAARGAHLIALGFAEPIDGNPVEPTTATGPAGYGEAHG